MSRVAVALQGLSKRFGPVHAVDDLELDIATGEVLALLGHNGAGKTTTIKMILGITAPSSGSLRVLGEAPRGPAARSLRLRIGYLPESVSFYGQLTGRQVLRYFARLKRVQPQRCDILLEQLGLGPAAGRRVKTYSKGMRQRLGLAQALLRPPELLLLDEPTVGLDPLATRDFFGILDELRREGSTVILCSHVLPGLEQHIDRAVILADGRLRAAGSLEQLRHEAGLPHFVRARGRWVSRDWEAPLRAQGVERLRLNGTALELEASPELKMSVVRLLLADPRLEEIEVRPPSLESLYSHFNDRLHEAPRGGTS